MEWATEAVRVQATDFTVTFTGRSATVPGPAGAARQRAESGSGKITYNPGITDRGQRVDGRVDIGPAGPLGGECGICGGAVRPAKALYTLSLTAHRCLPGIRAADELDVPRGQGLGRIARGQSWASGACMNVYQRE